MGYKVNPFTGKMDMISEGGESEKISSADKLKLGNTSDGNIEEGAITLTPDTIVSDAIESLNATLSYLLPDPPLPLYPLSKGFSTYTGKISDGFSNIGDLTPGNEYNFITLSNSNIIYTTTNTNRFEKADKGLLQLLDSNDNIIDEISLENNFNENERAGSQSYPPLTSPNGYITILSVHWYNDFPAYQVGQAKVNISSLINAGYNKFKLIHRISDTSIQEAESILLYYDNGGNPSITTFTANYNDNTDNVRWLSGIKYLNENEIIRLNILATNVANITYKDNPIVINGSFFNNTYINWNHPSNTAYNGSIPTINSEIHLENLDLHPNKSSIGVSPVINVTASKPGNRSTTNSIILTNLLYSISPTPSDDKNEYFNDENYRLPTSMMNNDTFSSITGQWNSMLKLNNGDAQVYKGSLVYPTIDFTSYHPVQSSDRDYSGFSGDQVYVRAIRDNGNPRSSGIISIDGIHFSDLTSNRLKIEIRLPSQTGWLDVGKYYSAADFTGSDGDGALVSYSESGSTLNLNWTSGTFNTVNSQYLYLIRITLKDSTLPPINFVKEIG